MKKIIFGSLVLIVCFVSYLFLYDGNLKSELNSPLNNRDSCIAIKLTEIKNIDQIDLIDTIHFLKLETKEDILWGHITKLRVYKNRIIIFDKRYAKNIFIYNKNGEFVNAINSIGRGPGEFVYLTNFEIDYNLDELVLMDTYQSKFLYFDLDGNFKREVISKAGATHAAFLKDKRIVHAKFADDFWKGKGKKDFVQIVITDENGEIIDQKSHHPENPDMNIQLYDVIKGLTDRTINYAPLLQDTIYSITPDGAIKPKYAIEYENNISERYQYEGSSDDLYKEVAQGKMCFLGHNIESENYLYFRLGVVWFSNPVFYSKISKKVIMIDRDRDGTFDLFEPLASDGDYFWGMILPHQIRKMKYDQVIIDSSKLTISEDDNPWLFYYRIKKF